MPILVSAWLSYQRQAVYGGRTAAYLALVRNKTDHLRRRGEVKRTIHEPSHTATLMVMKPPEDSLSGNLV